MRAAALATTLLLAFGASGCELLLGALLTPRADDPDELDDGPRNTPPDLGDVSLPRDRPIGPEDEIAVEAFDAEGLRSVAFSFRNVVRTDVSGTSASVAIVGRALGEGMGELVVSARDERGSQVFATFDDVIVDLSPPRIEPGPLVLRPDGGENGELRVWVGDAWMLGAVEVRFGDVVLVHDFPEGWPSTIGREWDWSLVAFPASLFPEGRGEAEIVATDAAGNASSTIVELTIDGTPPEVALAGPPDAEGGVDGPFAIEVMAGDEGGGPVWVELLADGAPVATAAGPAAMITLDARDFPVGRLELLAIARDRAGNEARSEPITIEIRR